METAKLIIGLGAVAFYYRITLRETPDLIFYGFLTLFSIYLVVYLISYANRPPRRKY